ISFFIKGSIVLFVKHLRYRYKLIHIHNVPDFLIFMGFIPKLCGAKLILDIHDILPEFFCEKFSRQFDSLLPRLLLFIENISVRFADHVIVSNDLWREKIALRNRLPLSKCTTLLNYPILEYFTASKSQSNPNSFRLIYPGTLSYHHGVDIAIRALALLKGKIPSIFLDIYTRSKNLDYSNSLASLIDQLGVRQIVNICDPLPTEAMIKELYKADIGIVPKRAGIFAAEAFSTKVLEFMAAGIPVISSRTKIDQYYFDDSMIMFFESENHEHLAECIYALYKDRSKREFLISNSKHFILQNNWELKKAIYFGLIESLTAW
ncbi:MAG: glycosyltransferase, partial [Candidatus Hodarchaeota archaeon]